MAQHDQSRYISSGYYLLPQNSLATVQSDYAFERDQVPRQLQEQKSEYHLSSLNMFDHGTRENYHYITADELRSLPASGENAVQGNVVSLSALRKRIDRMDSGFYRPILANGVLYFVASEDNPPTARSSDSQDSVRTAIQMQTESTAREPESTRTARFPQSPLVRPGSQPEIRLTLNQLKRLLGRELFKDVIRKYKHEHNARKSRISNTKTVIEPASTCIAKNPNSTPSSRAVEPDVSTHKARHVTRTMELVNRYPPLSPLVGSESNGSLHSASVLNAYDPSTRTARELTLQASNRTARGDSYFNRTPTAQNFSSPPATARSLHDGLGPNGVSSKDIKTAVNPESILHMAHAHNLVVGNEHMNIGTHNATSNKDVNNAVIEVSNSNASAHSDNDLSAELEELVVKAQQYLVPDLRRSMTEHGAIPMALAETPVFDERAVRSANRTSYDNELFHTATVDADLRTAREADSLTNVSEKSSITTTSSTMAI